MVNVMILFGIPVERVEFDEQFTRSYYPVLRRVPNVEELSINRVVGAARGDPPFYLIVELRFASEVALQDALNSEAGQAVARDLSEFASGGATVLFCQSSA